MRINDRIKTLASESLLDPLTTLTYGHFMCWQSSAVDSQAITLAIKLREQLGLPVSDVFYPYESMIKYEDIDIIKETGFKAIYGLDRYIYWFGPITDWSDPDFVKTQVEASKKIHEINGMKFFFQPSYGGFSWDSRWGNLDYTLDQWAGTDDGLFLWYRRMFLDMARDADQEKYFTLGTDLNLTSWLYPEDVERDFAWITAHSWIEVTTFSELLTRDWTPIPHPEIDLAPDAPLEQYQYENDGHYNAYFWHFYYGGVSDGHSPIIPAGVQIEPYFDYVPYLRDGVKIQPELKMGDEKTPGTIIYQTVENLKSAPENDLTTLAWLSYFTGVAEQTFHAQTFYAGYEESGADWGGSYLHPAAKFRANDVRQVNKIIAAAHWVHDVEENNIGEDSEILQQDLDLDGELEYVMRNQQLFLIFENDGGRIEYAFSYDPEFGPVQHIAPTYQHFVTSDGWGWNYEAGEIATAPSWNRAADAAFVDVINVGDLDYPVYYISIDGNHLEFTTPNRSFSKTYALNADQIHTSYKLNTVDQVEIGIGLVINMLNMYTTDWSEKVEIDNQNDIIRMKTENGGSSTLDLSDPNTYLIAVNSFKDSPARAELRERDSYDDYPIGHWLYYPYNTISFGAVDDFSVTLTLSSKPEDTGVNLPSSNFQMSYKLHNGYPNPFNSVTIIKFTLARPDFIELKVFNSHGKEIKTLVKKDCAPGSFAVQWDGTNANGNTVGSGIYFYQLQAGDFISVKKGLLLK